MPCGWEGMCEERGRDEFRKVIGVQIREALSTVIWTLAFILSDTGSCLEGLGRHRSCSN